MNRVLICTIERAFSKHRLLLNSQVHLASRQMNFTRDQTLRYLTVIVCMKRRGMRDRKCCPLLLYHHHHHHHPPQSGELEIHGLERALKGMVKGLLRFVDGMQINPDDVPHGVTFALFSLESMERPVLKVCSCVHCRLFEPVGEGRFGGIVTTTVREPQSVMGLTLDGHLPQ